MSTVTLAKIYEKQGHLADALEIYETLYQKNPADYEVKEAIDRIKKVNTKALKYFMGMQTPEQFVKFEKWLAKSWS